MNNLVKRGLTGAAFVAVMIGAIIWGSVSFSILFLFIILASANELLNLTLEKDGYVIRKILCLAATILPSLFVVLRYHKIIDDEPILYVGLFGLFLILLFISELFSKSKKPFNNLGFCCTAIVYIGFLLFPVFLLAFKKGTYYEFELILGILILTWSCDTFAYLTGSAFGKTPLFKRLSPKKTIEGSLGGLILTLGMALLLSKFVYNYSMMDWMTIALIACVIGTLGDLVESMLKRSLNIKDSGNILPGHGGFLDRFDSFILIVPAVSIYFIFKDFI